MVHAQNEQVMAAFVAELKKVWGKDSHMVEWSLKENYDEVIMLPSGHLYATDRPKIETRFCFGYHTDYSGHEHSDAIDAMHSFRNSVKAFKESNMEPLEEEIKNLTDSRGRLFIHTAYITKSNIFKIDYFAWNYYDEVKIPEGYEELTDADKQAILAVMNVTKAKFEKRLNTYIKRYGTSKLKTWTYWLDE